MRLLASLAIALLILWLVACGGKSGSNSQMSLGPVTRNAGTTSAAVVGPTSRGHIYGDHDSDDYYANGYNDADNDDIAKPTDRDGDSDNPSKSYYDKDDSVVQDFGHAASEADRKAIEALVRRYYAAAAVNDGATACSMIASPLARSVPEDLGRPPGPSYARGSTCALVMSKIFAADHRQMRDYAARLEVTSVRLDGGRGLAVLGFRTLPGRSIRVVREGGVWKVQALVDSEIP